MILQNRSILTPQPKDVIFPDVFYGKQRIYKVVNRTVMEYWWKDKVELQRESKDWSFLPSDETRNWNVEDSSQYSSIVAETPSKKDYQNQKGNQMYEGRNLKQLKCKINQKLSLINWMQRIKILRRKLKQLHQ